MESMGFDQRVIAFVIMGNAALAVTVCCFLAYWSRINKKGIEEDTTASCQKTTDIAHKQALPDIIKINDEGSPSEHKPEKEEKINLPTAA